MITLSPTQRRLTYVVIFETLAIVLSTILLSALSHGDASSSAPMAVAVSVIAVIWNFIYNSGFEAFERKMGYTDRSVTVRAAHAIGFEGGLVIFTVPLFMLWYQIGFVAALKMEAAILIFFLVFTFVFTWAFDKIFTLPNAPKSGH